MTHSIQFTTDAQNDLDDILAYISTHDGLEKALSVIERIEQRVSRLSELPERGIVPMECRQLGITDFREIFFKPYRIMYKILNNTVYIMLITDGRRDMQALLERRLLMHDSF